jgi:tetratricopeptide (TPR) repeat protein
MASRAHLLACVWAASALATLRAGAEPPRPTPAHPHPATSSARPVPAPPRPAPISVPPTPGNPAEESGVVKRAKQLFDKGAAAYDLGHYYEAIEIFSETDRLYPNPQLAFNIAKAYDNLGSKSGSLRYYRDYLRRSPEAPDRAAVEARVRQLETALVDQGVQQLTVITDPPEALLVLDGRPVGLTPWTGLTWPGKHQIEVRRERYQPDQFVSEVEPQRSAEVKIVLHELPESDPASLKHLPPAPARTRSSTRIDALTWTALITGGAALGTAIAIEAASPASADTIRPGTAFFAGLGTAATLTGGLLLYFRATEAAAAPPPRSAGPRPGLAVRLGRGSCSAKYTGHF